MVVAIPIFIVSDIKSWVIDGIHNPNDNVGKGNNNGKSFTSTWPEMDSLNTKSNLKQKRNKVLLKTFLRFSLTWKRRIELATIFAKRRRWQIPNRIETSENSYLIEARQLIYIANQFTGSVWGVFLLKGFWNKLSRLFSPMIE